VPSAYNDRVGPAPRSGSCLGGGRARWLPALITAALIIGPAPAGADGELRVGLPHLPAILDPASAATASDRIVFPLVFESMIRAGEHADFEPSLAARWSVSRDGLTWTFRLRPDARFHDGSPVTPRLVAASLARHLAPLPADHPMAKAPLPAWAQVFRGPGAVVREIRVEEPGAVQVHLKHPFSPLLAVLAQPALAIGLPQNDAEVPFLGTGPYRVVERLPGRLVLETVSGDAPRAARIRFLEVGDDATGIGGLRPGGSLDLYFPRNPPAWAGLGLQVLAGPTRRVGGLALRSDEGRLSDRALRRAVQAALDPKLVDPTLGPWAEPRWTLMPPAAGSASPARRPPHDPALARRLVTQAALADPVLRLLVPDSRSGPDVSRLVEAVRISLAVAGLTVRVRTEAADAYERALRNAETELALAEAAWEVSDPHFALWPLLASAAATRGSGTNVAFFRSPTMDALLLRGSQVAFRPERARVYQRIQALVAEEVPYIPLYARREWALARPAVRGLRLEPDGGHRLERVWVEGPRPGSEP
jgi:peptide/nickel transport system substrate-binding protein